MGERAYAYLRAWAHIAHAFPSDVVLFCCHICHTRVRKSLSHRDKKLANTATKKGEMVFYACGDSKKQEMATIKSSKHPVID